jgi:putative membrane protein
LPSSRTAFGPPLRFRLERRGQDGQHETEKPDHPAEKGFAAQMITDHTKTGTELKDLVPVDMRSSIPADLDESSRKKLDKLRETRDQPFASEYDPMQVSAHKDALSLFERYDA